MYRIPTADLFDQQNEKIVLVPKKGFFQKELSLLFIVGVIGCIGTMFIFSKGWYNSNSQTDHSLETISIPQKKNAIILSRKSSTHLEVEGRYVVDTKLKFKISNFNAQALYLVDFGDGTISELSTDKFTHSYSKSGEYRLQLQIKYRVESAILFEKIIQIRDSKKGFLTSL